MGLAGRVGVDALIQGQVPTPEHLDAYAELPSGRAGPLNGPLGAPGQGLDVLYGRGAAPTGVVVGMLGMSGHDPHEGVRGDVVAPKHVPTPHCGGGQDFIEPVRTTAPGGHPAIGTRRQHQPLRSLDPARHPGPASWAAWAALAPLVMAVDQAPRPP